MNQKTIILTIAAFLVFGVGCAQKNTKKNTAKVEQDSIKNKKTMINNFPFKTRDNEGQFIIIAETESPELYPKYASFFEEQGYSGNGYCWEGHIIQILEKLNPDLMTHIDFDPEAGCFFAVANTKENQMKFIELLSPIFADFTKLEKYIKQADRSRIDD